MELLANLHTHSTHSDGQYSPSSLLPRPGKSNGKFHITAYHFDPEYPPMKEYLAGMSLREADQTRQLFERGIALGKLHDITWQEVLDRKKSR